MVMLEDVETGGCNCKMQNGHGWFVFKEGRFEAEGTVRACIDRAMLLATS